MSLRRIRISLFLGLAAAGAGAAPPEAASLGKATFAGGCFWCMEKPFDEIPGVISTTSGYTGGQKKRPTYEEVSMGATGHAESVRIVFDPKKVSYERLLEVYWHNIDPTTAASQFCDHGSQYRPAIFFHDATQKQLAEKSKAEIEASGRIKGKIVVEIVPATEFYPAEDYHQDFYKKSPLRYQQYRMGCGRDRRLKELWGETAGH